MERLDSDHVKPFLQIEHHHWLERQGCRRPYLVVPALNDDAMLHLKQFAPNATSSPFWMYSAVLIPEDTLTVHT